MRFRTQLKNSKTFSSTLMYPPGIAFANQGRVDRILVLPRQGMLDALGVRCRALHHNSGPRHTGVGTDPGRTCYLQGTA